MMKRKTIIGCAAFALAAAMVLPGRAWANHGAGFLQVEEGAGARSVAMGHAGAADASVGFFYHNPAAPSLFGTSHLSVEYGQQNGDLSRVVVEPAFVFRNWFIAAGFYTQGIDAISSANEQGVAPSMENFTAQTTQIALGGGYRHPWFSLAVAANLLEERIQNYAGYGLTFSGGATAWIIPAKLAAGIAGFHLGTTKGMIAASSQSGLAPDDKWGQGPPLPRFGKVGVAWHDTLKSIGYSAALDVVYRDEDDRFNVPAGVEVWPIRYIALRLGKRFNHETEVVNMGFGVRVEPICADAGFVYSRLQGDSDFKWLLGLTYLLVNPAKAPLPPEK